MKSESLANVQDSEPMVGVENQEESYIAKEAYPLIQEGTYKVQCRNVEKNYSHNKALKMFLIFRIIDGPHAGIELFMAISLMDSRTGKPFKKVPRGSKYFQNWVIANRDRLPNRNDRMTSKIFKDAIFEAVVRIVKPKFPDGTDKPECFRYSIVDYLKKRLQ